MLQSTVNADLHAHIREAFPDHLERIRTYMAQPSVSEGNVGVRECAELLSESFRQIGCQEVEIAETPDLPAVWAHLDAGAAQTLAVYGFFDTNIVGTGWTHDPFDGVVTSHPDFPQVLYGRGASNKGGFMAFLNAIEVVQQVRGSLPVNLMFVCEGEEFVGSLHVPQLIERYREPLSRASGMLSPGPCQNAAGAVDLALGNKGCLHIEMRCSGEDWGRGPQGAPTHSSTMGVVDHPVWRLVHALSTLYDPATGNITVPGFLDGLREPTAVDLQLVEDLAARYANNEAAGVPGIGRADQVPCFVNDATGSEVFSRYCFLPTMNINGIRAGFTGPGTTLWTLPHEARCTIDHRLPPDLDPQTCLERIREHLDAQGYTDIHMEVLMSVGAQSLDLHDDLAQSALGVFSDWSVEPMVWPRRGASGPTGYFSQMLGLKVLGSTGLGYASGHSSADEFLVVEGDGRVGGIVELTGSYADLLCSLGAD